MNYILVKEGKIDNVIEADEDFAKLIGAKPYYAGASVGDFYNPPTLDGLTAEVNSLQKENNMLKAQLQAQSDRADFIEDCIAEMAVQVYGGV